MASPKISSTMQNKIEVLIQKWAGKLTWDALVHRVTLEYGIKTTRQTLCTYSGISKAFKEKKAVLRGVTPVISASITKSDVTLQKRVDYLDTKIIVLERKIHEQLRFIERMLSNAKDIPNIDLNHLIRPRHEEINDS